MIFSLFDDKVSSFGPIFEARNEAEAKRTLMSAVLFGKDQLLKNYSEDFTLFKLGDFDPDSGKLSVLDNPTKVISGFELKLILNRGVEVENRSEHQNIEIEFPNLDDKCSDRNHDGVVAEKVDEVS